MVCFIKHGDLDGIEVKEALLHEVLETTRGGHNDIDAGLECCHLTSLRDAAKDGGHAQVVGICKRNHCVGDLGCQFTSRRKDKTQGATWSTTTAS